MLSNRKFHNLSKAKNFIAIRTCKFKECIENSIHFEHHKNFNNLKFINILFLLLKNV